MSWDVARDCPKSFPRKGLGLGPPPGEAVSLYATMTYVNSRKLFILSRIAGPWGCKVPIYKVQSPYNNNDTRKGKGNV